MSKKKDNLKEKLAKNKKKLTSNSKTRKLK